MERSAELVRPPMSMAWARSLSGLLARRRPFKGGTPMETLTQVQEYHPEPPSQ